jgi:hypothetical protein
VADVIDAAAADVEARKKAALDAMANAGTAGLEALKTAQTNVRQEQNTALSAALGDAARRGAPGAMQQEVTATIRQPGDVLSQGLAAAQGRYSAEMARRAAANSDYFAQASAAVPAIRAASDREISFAKARWEEQRRREEQAAAAKQAADDAKWEQIAKATGLSDLLTEQALTKQQGDLAAQIMEHQKAAADLHAQRAKVNAAVNATMPSPYAKRLIGHEALDQGTSVGALSGDPQQAALAKSLDDQMAMRNLAIANLQKQQEQVNAQLADRAARAAQVAGPRQAYLDIYGNDPQHQALAYGMFPGATTEQMLSGVYDDQEAAFVNQYGYRPSPTQLQRFVRGEDPAPAKEPKGVQRVDQVATQIGLNDPKKVEQITSSPAYATALAAAKEAAKSGTSMAEAQRIIDSILTEDFGHTFPTTTKLVLAQYAPEFAG